MKKFIKICKAIEPGFSFTPYLESFTPTFGLGTPVFPRISSNLHSGTPTFSKRCLWDSYFQNPSENPGHSASVCSNSTLALVISLVTNCIFSYVCKFEVTCNQALHMRL